MIDHTPSATIVPDMPIHATIGLVPVVAFITNITPILTAISALFAICWFGVLFYDRFVNKTKGKDIG